jgi:hypothetical protein
MFMDSIGYCFGSVFNQTNSVYYVALLGYDYGESATFFNGTHGSRKKVWTPLRDICFADQYHVDEIRADPHQPGTFW